MENYPIDIMKKVIKLQPLRIKISGKSMEPVLRENDVVEFSVFKEIIIGDIILFFFNGKYVTHRVVEIYKDMIITQGDNNLFLDSPILKENVIGKLNKKNINMVEDQKIKVVYNIWNEKIYKKLIVFKDILNINIIFQPETIFNNAINIGIYKNTVENISSLRNMKFTDIIYVHLGLESKNLYNNGQLIFTRFNKVLRSGSIISSNFLNEQQKFLILYGEINLILTENRD